MPQEWYYAKDNQKYGPISASELKQLASTGKLEPSDLIRKEGMKEWKKAKTLKGLFSSDLPVAPKAAQDQQPIEPMSDPETERTTMDSLLTRVKESLSKPTCEPEEPMSDPETERTTMDDWLTRVKEIQSKLTCETRACVLTTFEFIKRLSNYCRDMWKKMSLRRAKIDSRHTLGECVFRKGIGHHNLREKITTAIERKRTIEAAKGSTKGIDLEIKGLTIRLADAILDGDESYDDIDEEISLARNADSDYDHHLEKISAARSELFPSEEREMKRLAGGIFGSCIAIIMIILIF